jgi:hypothetical protein
VTPHVQSATDDRFGNCFATCIACVLDLPAAAVPNFRRAQEESSAVCMVDEADKWLRENHGLRLISIELYDQADGPTKGSPLTRQCILNRLAHRNADELVILSGESPRATAGGRKKYHCVVGRATCWGFELVHDPHPDGGGIVGQPYGVKWIIPIPARSECRVPPPGWRCTREPGHGGPCAALSR